MKQNIKCLSMNNDNKKKMNKFHSMSMNKKMLISLTKETRIFTSRTADCAASLEVKVIKAYPRFNPVIGSIISRRSQIVPHFSNSGINSSSYISFGIFPQKTLRKQIKNTYNIHISLRSSCHYFKMTILLTLMLHAY